MSFGVLRSGLRSMTLVESSPARSPDQQSPVSFWDFTDSSHRLLSNLRLSRPLMLGPALIWRKSSKTLNAKGIGIVRTEAQTAHCEARSAEERHPVRT